MKGTMLVRPDRILPVVFALALLLLLLAKPSDRSPRLSLDLPLEYQVAQREKAAEGRVVVAGRLELAADAAPVERLEARLIRPPGSVSLGGSWQRLPYDSRVAAFSGSISGPAGGWYRLEVRAVRGSATIAEASVAHVGIGEVFVVAGQSNSANFGEERQRPASGMVAAFSGTSWQLADDPQPGAGGKDGSFLPAFGDALYATIKVPIGLASTGIGSTSVREWLPRGVRFSILPTLTGRVVTVGPGVYESNGAAHAMLVARMKSLGPRGFRAVLWHQGESDAHQRDAGRTLPGPLYREYLQTLIASTRAALGWDVPWFVALASYHTPDDPASPDIRAAQRALWEAGVALEGPDSDSLRGDLRQDGGLGVHFSGKGLRAHGRLWAEKVRPWLEGRLATHQGDAHQK